MMWRQLVQQWFQQTARGTLSDLVSEAARTAQYRFASPEAQAAALRERADRCPTVVVFALGVESGGTVDRLQGGVSTRCPNFVEHAGQLGDRRVALIESGVGRAAAARAVDDVIALHHPRWVVSAGFAGALRPQLHRGHVVMADEIIDTEQHSLTVGLHVDRAAIESSPALHLGRLLTVDHLVHSAAEKRRLGEQWGALACDLETMAVAEVCQRAQTRFLSVRIITDTVDDELPKEIEKLLAQSSTAARWGAAAGALLNRPSRIKDLWNLKEEAVKASDRLAKFLVGIVAQLGEDPGTEAGRLA